MDNTNPSENNVLNKFESRLRTINQHLKESKALPEAPGLFHGKAGIALYFYLLSELTGSDEALKTADDLIDQIYESLVSNVLLVDFENGLAGIGWTFEYIVRNGFVEADTNDILEDIDNKVFQKIVHSDKIPLCFENGLLGYMTYVLARLQNCNNTEIKRVLERLLIELINRVGNEIARQQIDLREPSDFDIMWELPLVLLVLGDALKLNVFNYKIIKIIEELEVEVCSLLPLRNCNRLFLLVSMLAISQAVYTQHWKKHIDVLSNNIDFEIMLTNEFLDKNISINKGLSGIVILLTLLEKQKGVRMPLADIEVLKAHLVDSQFWSQTEAMSAQEQPIEQFAGSVGVATSLILLESLYKKSWPDETASQNK